MGVLFAWWLAVEVLGVLGLPLAAVLFARLPDRGIALSKPLSLLVCGWLVWFPLTVVSALPYGRGTIVVCVLLFALGNGLLLRLPVVRAALRHGVVAQRWHVVRAELVFAAAFAGMGWLRSFTPAVVDTEKFMDQAFIAAIWRAPHLPPPDPWLSGEPINYYYYGHFLISSIARVLGTVPAVAFNCGVVLIFALAAVAVFGVVSNLAAVHAERVGVGASLAGLVGVVLVLVLGDLNGAQVWWHDATALARTDAALGGPWGWWLHPAVWAGYDWWSPSRVVLPPNTINEFPAFSFVLADLHAHVLALPFDTLAVGVALNLLLATRRGVRAFGRSTLGALGLVTAGLVIGSLYVINGWDLPTYLGLAVLALAVQQWLAHDRQLTRACLLDFLAAALPLGALSVVLFLPFYYGFSSPSQGIGTVPLTVRSPVGEVFAVFGLPIFIVGSLVTLRLAGWAGAVAARAPGQSGRDHSTAYWLGGGAVIGGVLALVCLTRATSGYSGWTPLWCVLIISACAALALHELGFWRLQTQPDEAPAPQRSARLAVWIYCLFGTAAALVLTCEIIYLRDVFNFGAIFRMNTVFKLYYQAWLLSGLAAGVALVQLITGMCAALSAVWAKPAIHVSDAAPTPQLAAATAVSSAPTPFPVRGEGEPDGHDAAQFAVHGARFPLAPQGEGVGVEDFPMARRAVKGPVDERGGVLRWVGASGIVIWCVLLIGLVGAAAIYPVLASDARTAGFTGTHSLDGTAYMATDAVNQGDGPAIIWLNTHVQGDPVIVEAASFDEYTHLGRVSAFTGLPTVLGWGGHEVQWRYNWLLQPDHSQTLGNRLNAVKLIYTSSDSAAVLAELHQYAVRYVYVGAAERQQYPGATLSRFGGYLHMVYQHAGVTIYAVPRAGAAG